MSALQQRVAVVTGAGQGLGRAIALALATAGFDVALLGRTEAKLKDTAALMQGRTLCLALDLTDPDAVRAGFARIAAQLGGIDVLINNAAGYMPFALEHGTDEQIESVIRQTLTAPIYCIREALAWMRKRGAGDIVNVSSQSAETPQPHMVVYGAAKAGLEAISRGLRYELRGEPFRVMTLQPGVIAGTVLGPDWRDRQAAYAAAQQKAGMERAFVFPGAEPSSIAAAIVHAVTAPRDILLETIAVRGSGAT